LVVLFLGITLILLGALAWLGWRLFQQDRALEQQRVRDRLENAADIVATELHRRLTDVDGRLSRLATTAEPDLPQAAAQYAQQLSDDALLVVMEGNGVQAYPRARLLYYPVLPQPDEPPASVFASGESFEFRDHDFVAAARVFRRIAQSEDWAVRAGALLRLARAERKANRLDGALDAYAELAGLESISVEGLPADLVALSASLDLLSEMSRRDELQSRAAAVYHDLHGGRWLLTRAQYEFYLGRICRWMPCDSDGDAGTNARVESMRTLAAGVEWLWSRVVANSGDSSGTRWIDGRPALLVWRGSADRTVALVGGVQHLEQDWLAALEPLSERHQIEVALADISGNDLTSRLVKEAPLQATRTMADTRLPWTVHVTSADPGADFAQLGERRRLMLLGLATLGLFVLVGLYAVTRGVTRELEAARLQSDFVAAVSHEFRTPLTSLQQFAELLSSGRITSEEDRNRYYKVMERESGRLHRLVEGLLDFGRMEAGALEFHWEQVAIGGLVRSVVTEFESEMADNGYRVELTDDGSAATARADVEALSRGVWNLLDNAVKYSPECKTVWVDVKCEDGQVAIAVRDRGVGIPLEEQKSIFEKFVRGASPDGRATKGTGIGLAMVRHIVDGHGGEIRVASEPGVGSTFTILLPLED
jgi:signal transduction histidine kinase